MALSEEQIKDFEDIKKEIIHLSENMVEVAEIFSRGGDTPKTGGAYRDAAEVMERLADSIRGLDLSESYDSEKIEAFEHLWQEAMQIWEIRKYLNSLNADYDEIWKPLENLFNYVDKFLEDIKKSRTLNQEQTKEDLESEAQTPDVQKEQNSETTEQAKPQEPKQVEKQDALKNFTKGTQSVIKMDEQYEIHDQKKKTPLYNNLERK